MNTVQINKALTSDPAVGPCFLGVFPCDKLPVQIRSFPAAVVANTDPSYAAGEHWVAFFFDNDGNAEYFDSYGFAPVNCNLMRFFEQNGKNHTWNKEQLQSITSKVCGQWCIAYLAKRGRGQSRAQIVHSLKTGSKAESDHRIGELVNEAFDIVKQKQQHPKSRQNGSGKYHSSRNFPIQCCCSRSDKLRLQ